MMPRQPRLRQIVEVAKAAPTTLFLPRRWGRIPALLGDLRRATAGAVDPLGPPQQVNGFIALDLIQPILKVDHRRGPSVAVVRNPSRVAPDLRWDEPSSAVWNRY